MRGLCKFFDFVDQEVNLNFSKIKFLKNKNAKLEALFFLQIEK